MTPSEREAIVRRLTARGVRVLDGAEASPENILGLIREQRRRHAHEPRFQALGPVAARLASELRKATDTAPQDISRLLLSLTSKLSALAIGHGVPAPVLLELLNFAADDLDQQAKAGGETGDDG